MKFGPRRLAAALCSVAILAGSAGVAFADSDRSEYRYRSDDGDCRYEYREKKGKIRERVDCREHGRSKKRRDGHDERSHHVDRSPVFYHVPALPWRPLVVLEREQYQPPVDLRIGRCNSALTGAILGGAVGGVAGAQFGKGDGQTAATAVGALIGVLIGSDIGRSLDSVDRACLGQALEFAPDGRAVSWQQPDGRPLEVVPQRTFNSNGSYCRDYIARATVGGRSDSVTGTACRLGDGSWRIVS